MLSPFRTALGFVGRHAASAYALSIFLGLSLPQLAAVLRPMIPISIFVFILLSFARANLPGIRAIFQRPARMGYGLVLSTLVPPLVGWGVLWLVPELDPGIRLGIALMAAAPPLMASPVYAAVLGFENSFALALLVLGMVLAPIASPFFASVLAGAEVPISPLVLAQRLIIFIGGGMLAGIILRRITGIERLTVWKNELDGVGVLLFFLFAIAAMDGVIDATLRDPLLVFAILAASTGFSVIAFGINYLLCRHFGFNDRFSVSICVGLRNMGLLIAPIISLVPQTTFLYFALAQVPIYVAPVILRALKARLEPKAVFASELADVLREEDANKK